MNNKKHAKVEDIQLIAYGAADEVGRSAFILEDSEHRVLIEAGIKLRADEPSLAPIGLKERAMDIDAILLSHAHVDHSGYIPALFDNGYTGKLYMTEPTLDIATVLWTDHYKIEGDRHWTPMGMEAAYDATITTKYRKKIEILEGITVEFLNSGHILGAAMIYINWKGVKILFTGDINDQQTPLFEGFEIPDENIDILITESTNGIREITPRTTINQQLIQEVISILESGKKVIIPCFAVGRSQEILCILTEHIKSYPIYVDGMINTMNLITEKYLNSDWVDKPILERLKREKRQSPFTYDNVFPITRDFYDQPHNFRKFIGQSKEPAIIITTSGMMMPSPVHTHMRFAAQVKGNLIAITGYQAEGTLGREVLEGKRRVKLSSGYNRTQNVMIRASVKRFGFSGHVSYEGIQDLIKQVKPKQIILMHGDPLNQSELGSKLQNGTIPKQIQALSPVKLVTQKAKNKLN